MKNQRQHIRFTSLSPDGNAMWKNYVLPLQGRIVFGFKLLQGK